MFRTANPALNSKTFTGLEHAADSTNVMTIQGTVNRTAFLLFLVLITSSWIWNKFFETGDPSSVGSWIMIGVFGGLVFCSCNCF